MKKILTSISIITLAIPAAIWWALNSTPITFCDLVFALDIAMDIGEDIYNALTDFYETVTTDMINALHIDIQKPAKALLATIDNLLSAPKLVASFIFNTIDPFIEATVIACNITNA